MARHSIEMRRIFLEGRQQPQLRGLYEATHGPIPARWQIHLIDHNPDNLDPANLRAVSRLEHQRIHAAAELRDGAYWKACTGCGVWKPEAEFYAGFSGPVLSRCVGCHIGSVRGAQERRKARALCVV